MCIGRPLERGRGFGTRPCDLDSELLKWRYGRHKGHKGQGGSFSFFFFFLLSLDVPAPQRFARERNDKKFCIRKHKVYTRNHQLVHITAPFSTLNGL